MKIFPAIDLSEGCAVRLLKGDYAQKTVYSDDPVSVAKGFREAGGEILHLVDLDGAKAGYAAAAEIVAKIAAESGMFVEIGGGIRNAETVKQYLDAGVGRVILGTAALRDRAFLEEMIRLYGEKIAVGVDIKNGNVAVQGWTEDDGVKYTDFLDYLEKIGVATVICTDVSKDGAMQGTNRELYRELAEKYSFKVVASGGVSTLDDIKALAKMDIYGAIVGRALYNGAINLKEAIAVTKE
ncbi:MAG: 1-(5-phosphoribosyl)-5-[Clostridia bacterium]|nr:1-(5-phosphoribosyl)-5-[(5-phosphoribosylamino)methylideneamino]imidazole-4-carboxamide isomerase [Clostridia bacterium]